MAKGKERKDNVDERTLQDKALDRARWPDFDRLSEDHPEVSMAIIGVVNGMPTSLGLSALATAVANVFAHNLEIEDEDEMCMHVRSFARYLHQTSHRCWRDVREPQPGQRKDN